MANEAQKTTKEFLIQQVQQDPGLPRPHPTPSFWQRPGYPTLFDKQSLQLPATTDVAIIGSGITGCSVAQHLLDISNGSALTLTVLEARTLTSGATGRNGGLLSSFVPEEFAALTAHYGIDEAVKIARFVNRNLRAVHELADSSFELRMMSQVRCLKDVICYSDRDLFEEAKKSYTLYEESVPGERGKSGFLTPEEAAKKFNIRAPAGAITFPNGSCWPYRLITDVWSEMLSEYESRLSIETNTPVVSITYDPKGSPLHPYILHTPRGIAKAAQVVHATNGYAGHLLPALRGAIYPFRGTMSVQESTPAFGNHGKSHTWSMVNSRVYDPATDVVEAGTYYAHQNALSGDIFIGGERTKLSDLFVADDTAVNPHCAENLATLLPRYFIKGWERGGDDGPEIRSTWTGVMGFTGDRLPVVGQLPQRVTQRGHGEWIAAGFSGYGMALCWSCGEAVARMILGMDVSDFLPDAFLPTSKRIEEPAQRGPLDAMLDLIAE